MKTGPVEQLTSFLREAKKIPKRLDTGTATQGADIRSNRFFFLPYLNSTAVGDGVAVPHARCAAVNRASLAAITVPAGLDYDSPDGEPSKLFFMIAAPENGGDVHMDMLAHLMVMLMDEEFCQKLLDATDLQEFLNLIDAQERVKFPEEAPAEAAEPASGLRVLAITACPTGIAHTYMAAEALEKKGRELNIGVKAETQGSGGAKNSLTREEIAASDPLHILPSCISGAAVAGALSMALGCASPAPHGGLFVLPVIRNPLGFAAAVAIGSVVGMVVLGLLKKKK